jgi:hypothetical protein
MATNTTKTDKKTKPTPQDYTIPNAIGLDDWSFTGVSLASATTQSFSRAKVQWTEMGLYRVTTGPNTGLYILEIVGCSNVYHRVGAECTGSQNGEVIPNSDLPEEAQPCFHCRPGAQGKDTLPDQVSLELDWPQLHECATPADVINKLREGADGKISNPAQRLLLEAAGNDTDMHAALHKVRRI